MSFLFKKKVKEVKVEKAVINELQPRVEEAKAEVKAEAEPVAQVVQEEVKPVLEESTEKAVDGGATTEVPAQESPVESTKPAADEETKVADGETKMADGESTPADKEEKSEKSPLVNGKDMGPGGCLCCTIL